MELSLARTLRVGWNIREEGTGPASQKSNEDIAFLRNRRIVGNFANRHERHFGFCLFGGYRAFKAFETRLERGRVI